MFFFVAEHPKSTEPPRLRFVHICTILGFVNGGEFIRRVKRVGRTRAAIVRFESRPGKGSHGRLYYGDRFTTVKDRKKEIGKGLLAEMIKQLGLTPDDLDL